MNARLALGAVALGLFLSIVSLAAAPAPTAPAGPVAAQAYVLDGTHASVVFKATHLGISNFYGTFDQVEGELQFSADDLDDSVIAISIKADSIDSNSGQRDGHLKSPDFLNAVEFPEITFVSTKVEPGRGDDHYKVTGMLGFRGTQEEIVVDAVKTGEGDTPFGPRIGFEVKFVIDMKTFRVPFVLENEGAPVGQEVELIIAAEFAQGDAGGRGR